MRPWAKRKPDKTEMEIKSALRDAGATVYSVNAIGKAGFPDLVIGFMGITALAECKTKEGKLRDTQKEFMVAWRGGPVFVLKDAVDVESCLKAMVSWR